MIVEELTQKLGCEPRRLVEFVWKLANSTDGYEDVKQSSTILQEALREIYDCWSFGPKDIDSDVIKLGLREAKQKRSELNTQEQAVRWWRDRCATNQECTFDAFSKEGIPQYTLDEAQTLFDLLGTVKSDQLNKILHSYQVAHTIYNLICLSLEVGLQFVNDRLSLQSLCKELLSKAIDASDGPASLISALSTIPSRSDLLPQINRYKGYPLPDHLQPEPRNASTLFQLDTNLLNSLVQTLSGYYSFRRTTFDWEEVLIINIHQDESGERFKFVPSYFLQQTARSDQMGNGWRQLHVLSRESVENRMHMLRAEYSEDMRNYCNNRRWIAIEDIDLPKEQWSKYRSDQDQYLLDTLANQIKQSYNDIVRRHML